MKKNIIILTIVVIATSLTAFGFKHWSMLDSDQEQVFIKGSVAFDFEPASTSNNETDVDLVYNVDHRFATSVTREQLHNAKSIIDILPKRATESRASYENARVSILGDEMETTEIGDSEILNAAQIKLLQSVDYSANIRITSIGKNRNDAGELAMDSLVYYMTVIPEHVAQFEGGQDALITYLRENSREKVAVIEEDERQASRVSFTVTKKGTIADVKMTGTTGYTSVDKALVDLIIQMPQKWTPASNSKGEKVDQQLVFFFGLQGC